MTASNEGMANLFGDWGAYPGRSDQSFLGQDMEHINERFVIDAPRLFSKSKIEAEILRASDTEGASTH